MMQVSIVGKLRSRFLYCCFSGSEQLDFHGLGGREKLLFMKQKMWASGVWVEILCSSSYMCYVHAQRESSALLHDHMLVGGERRRVFLYFAQWNLSFEGEGDPQSPRALRLPGAKPSRWTLWNLIYTPASREGYSVDLLKVEYLKYGLVLSSTISGVPAAVE